MGAGESFDPQPESTQPTIEATVAGRVNLLERTPLFIPNAATELLRPSARLFARQHRVDRILQTVMFDGALIHVVVDRAGVNDFPMPIQQESVRGASRAILTATVLRRV